jgi:hypothetical protein
MHPLRFHDREGFNTPWSSESFAIMKIPPGKSAQPGSGIKSHSPSSPRSEVTLPWDAYTTPVTVHDPSSTTYDEQQANW